VERTNEATVVYMLLHVYDLAQYNIVILHRKMKKIEKSPLTQHLRCSIIQ
jgi:hypothetical protein